jgi:hypothetical protein
LLRFFLSCLAVGAGINGLFSTHASAASNLTLQTIAGSSQITNLTFANDSADLDIENLGDRAHYYAVIDGHYLRKNWILIIGRVKVPRDPADGHFKIKTELLDRQKQLNLASIGPDGQIEFQTIKITYSRFPIEKRPTRNSFALGLGVTHMWYTQDASSFASPVSYMEDTLTLKGSYVYRLAPPHWDLGFSAFVSTLTFGSSLEGTSVRSLGVNARIGYNIPIGHTAWTFSIMGGLYYTTMFVSPSTFGFQNLAGPQLFPVIRRTLSNQDTLSFYAKYSPVSSGSFSLQPSSREIAGGFTYNYLLQNGHSIPVSLDISNLKATAQLSDATTGVSQSVNIELTTVSLSAGYTF